MGGDIVVILQESLYWILVFAGFLMFALFRSEQGLRNLILALYFALLIAKEFPYYDAILSGTEANKTADSVLMVVVFIVFTFLASKLFGRLMPRDHTERAFEQFGKKIILALAASVLVMAYSYNALPITDIITPGSPVQALFGPEQHFFWWLIVPLVVVFFI